MNHEFDEMEISALRRRNVELEVENAAQQEVMAYLESKVHATCESVDALEKTFYICLGFMLGLIVSSVVYMLSRGWL